MDKKSILSIYNNHIEESGTPPEYTNKNSEDYFGYFENEHGEQWIFFFDRKKKKGELRGGDVGWEEVYEVVNGQVKELILNSSEQTWLKSCWDTATSF